MRIVKNLFFLTGTTSWVWSALSSLLSCFGPHFDGIAFPVMFQDMHNRQTQPFKVSFLASFSFYFKKVEWGKKYSVLVSNYMHIKFVVLPVVVVRFVRLLLIFLAVHFSLQFFLPTRSIDLFPMQ